MRFSKLTVAVALVSCGGGSSIDTGAPDGSTDSPISMSHDSTTGTDAPGEETSSDGGTKESGPPMEGGASCAGTCPTGYTCGTANGLPVCRAASGIPMFSHIFIIMMENTSLSTLKPAMSSGKAPNLAALAAKYATSSGYHGVSHPSLPNYVALTSGGTQGIGCDCQAQPGQGACGTFSCTLVTNSCSCDLSVMNLADQIEGAKATWMAFGEGMSTPCNDVDDGTTQYAVRHVPFIYYDDIRTDTSRCQSHVVDMTGFAPDSAPTFTFIAPNLTDDMHDPVPSGTQNIVNGDKWIGPEIDMITASPSYTNGGLLLVIWDEDDDSGGITGSNDPVPIFVLSPYAKSGGYVSTVGADHYSTLATVEDAMNLTRLGSAGKTRPMRADTLADFFPSK